MLTGIILSMPVLFLMSYSQVSIPVFFAIFFACSALLIIASHGHSHSHGTFLSIDAMSQKSGLSKWSTGLKLALVLICVFACTAAQKISVPVYLFIVMNFLTILIGKTRISYYLSLFSVPLVFVLMSCLAVLIEFFPAPSGILSVKVGSLYACVTLESQAKALTIMLRSLGAISCLYFLCLSTPMYRIIESLRKVKIPSVVIELMYLIYRYLFILLETHQNMVYASSSRLGYRGYRTSMKTAMKNALNLIFVSFRQTADMFSAMEARCYDSEIRFLCSPRRATGTQIAISLAVLTGMIVVWIFAI